MIRNEGIDEFIEYARVLFNEIGIDVYFPQK